VKLDKTTSGVFFALSAAALNGTIGVFSKVLIAQAVSPAWIAFLKTAIGLAVLSMILFFMKQKGKSDSRNYLVAIIAFLGIFTLFYFETNSYEKMSAANTVIILMATGALTANLAGWKILGDKPGRNQWVGLFLTVAGVAAILGINAEISFQGVLFAICAGIGYGLFTVLLKKYKVKGGLVITRQLLCWGAIFLFLPAIQQSLNFPLSLKSASALLGLALLPSILGFYCTTRAIDYLSPSRVQLLELSEPLFAASIAFAILGERVTPGTAIGAVFSMAGIYIGALKAMPTIAACRVEQ
jgi:DME family drug/metabolite transporter